MMVEAKKMSKPPLSANFSTIYPLSDSPVLSMKNEKAGTKMPNITALTATTPMLCCRYEEDSDELPLKSKKERRSSLHDYRASRRQASRKEELLLIAVSILTALFIVAELIGGYLAHSLAIMTDAFHMISDLASFLVSIFAIHLARRPPSAKYPFGMQRAEVLGALASISLIWVLTAFLIYLAVERIVSHSYSVEADTMMITAGIAVLFNLIVGALLHVAGGSHLHSHHGHGGHKHGLNDHHGGQTAQSRGGKEASMENGINSDTNNNPHHHNDKSSGNGSSCSSISSSISGDEHDSTTNAIKEIQRVCDVGDRQMHANLNIRAAFIHVLGDLVQSVGVLFAAVIIKLTGFELADPLCTFLFGILVLLTTMPVLRDVFAVLLESSPSNVDAARIVHDLISIPGVYDVHNLRIWSLKLDSIAVSAHLDIIDDVAVIGEGGAIAAIGEIVAEAHHRLHTGYHVDFITIQIDCRRQTRKRVGEGEVKCLQSNDTVNKDNEENSSLQRNSPTGDRGNMMMIDVMLEDMKRG